MQDYKKQFKGKKITVMGLGLLGRGLGYTKFLAECGADLIVTDLKSKKQLATSIKALKKFRSIKYVLGEHRLEDFRGRDMIIKSAGVPLDSIYIKEAEKNGIPIEMDVSLFAKCAPEIILVGVTGTRGKSMVTALIYEILKKNEKFLNRKVYIGGNVRGVATLPLLKKVKAGDILVCELDSWQLQGFGDSKISPHISVFTSFMPDHMNYYKNSMEKYFDDKANIFKYQKKEDFLIIRKDVENLIKNFPSTLQGEGRGEVLKGKLIIANKKSVEKYKFIVPGEHQKENLACAVEVAILFNIPDSKIGHAVKHFKGLEGRLQYVKTVRGVKIYNDNNATTPEATVAGIKALSFPETRFRGVSPKPGFGERKIVLICGGADKKLPLDNFVKTVNKHCKAIIMIPGTGTDRLANEKLSVENFKVKNLQEAVKKALLSSKKDDIILFSPAFASFGMFNNEYERNDLFLKLIKEL
ncbi:MAG: UDP-N-acetylmuramoyl-L-alanine--D-glutamate ligase [Candidatus Paceibacterota bacterium]